MDITNLTPDEKAKLKKQLDAEEKAEVDRIENERKQYKDMVDEAVVECFPQLVVLSSQIRDAKKLVFDTFDTIIAMKADLFGMKDGQQSHTFTSKNGFVSIKMGYRVKDAYDDTLQVGIEKVKNYIATLAKDDETKALVKTILNLLREDANGSLKASRVLELSKLATEVKNPEFTDGIQIIQKAYKPSRTCQFVEVKFKDNKGVEHSLPLAMSAFDLDTDIEQLTERKEAKNEQ